MYLPERSAAVQKGVIDAENDFVPTYVGVPWMFPLAVVQCCNDPGTAHMKLIQLSPSLRCGEVV